MLFFAHVFIGTVLGVVLARLLGDSRFVPVCIVGSILPDLIDKPVGYLIFPDSLDSGTTLFHSFVIVIIAFFIAFFMLRFWHTFLGMALAGIILLHQIMDEMWHLPATWSYPATGSFQTIHYDNFFETYFWVEITTLSEWLFFFSTVVLLCWFFRAGSVDTMTGPNLFLGVSWLSAAVLLLGALGIYSLVCAATGMNNFMALCNSPEYDVFLGLLALAGCGLIIKIPRIKPLQAKNR